jgi:AcrR family transcriptional regulator
VKARERRKTETREALLDSAARVFARRGYHDASLEEIAREAGRTTGSVYSSFRGKDDLFLALLERHVEQESDAVARGVDLRAAPDEAIRQGFAIWLDFVRREPDVFLLSMEFWSRAARNPEIRERYVTMRRRQTKVISYAVQALQAARDDLKAKPAESR